MKRRLTITPDNRPAGVRVILANRKGHILYDRTKKGRLRVDETQRRQTKETTDSLPQKEGKRK